MRSDWKGEGELSESEEDPRSIVSSNELIVSIVGDQKLGGWKILREVAARDKPVFAWLPGPKTRRGHVLVLDPGRGRTRRCSMRRGIVTTSLPSTRTSRQPRPSRSYTKGIDG